MNGEKMYEYLLGIGPKGRRGILDVTWWDVETLGHIRDGLLEGPESETITREERKVLSSLTDDDFADVLDKAIENTEGDGMHTERVRQAIRDNLLCKMRSKCGSASKKRRF